MYLLDTNIVSEPVKPKPNPNIIKKLFAQETTCYVSSLTWHELYFGYARLPKSNRKTKIDLYLEEVVFSTFKILPYDKKAAEWHASERGRLAQLGKTPPFVDGQIASIAQTNSLILVTNNIKDFAQFDELHIQNWK